MKKQIIGKEIINNILLILCWFNDKKRNNLLLSGNKPERHQPWGGISPKHNMLARLLDS